MRHRFLFSRRHAAGLLIAASAALFGACGGSDDETPRQLDIDFNSASTDWVLGSSDYSEATAPVDVQLAVTRLGAPFNAYALSASGQNRSDDLWLYVKKRFDGLTPGRWYQARLSLTMLASIPQGCVGVGGAPGESVYVKAGLAGVEPLTLRVAGEFVMNIDKGVQSQAGSAALVLGDLTNSSTDCRPVPAEAKTMIGAAPLRVQADADGAVWVFFGIDSGFEAGSVLTLMSARVELAGE